MQYYTHAVSLIALSHGCHATHLHMHGMFVADCSCLTTYFKRLRTKRLSRFPVLITLPRCTSWTILTYVCRQVIYKQMYVHRNASSRTALCTYLHSVR